MQLSSFLKAFTVLSFGLALLFGCQRGQEKPPVTVYGKATYYADRFQGRTTANGEIFDQDSLTAATKDTIPFGTIIRVTNLNNDSVVTVRVNDRIGSRYSIDLTRAASEQLDMREEGVVPVKMELLNYRDLTRRDSL